MRLAILSRNEGLYSTRVLVEAARKRGHSAQVLDTLQFDIRLSKQNPQLFYRGRAVRPGGRRGPAHRAPITFFGLAVVRQFEMMGLYCVNESQAIARSRDKLRCLQILSRHDIGLRRRCTRGRQTTCRRASISWMAPRCRQAAPGHAGRGRRPGREHPGGQLGHRGVSRPGSKHPHSEIHP